MYALESLSGRLRRGLGCSLVLGLSLPLLAVAAPSSSVAAIQAVQPGAGIVATLSNLKTLSRWAYPEAAVAVHSGPTQRSRVLGHLKLLTGEGQAQPYLALRSYSVGSSKWILVPVPGRPNGLKGWVPAHALGEMHVTRDHLRIDRETLQATLYRGARQIWNAPAGVGRPALPTPAGHFYVIEKLIAIGSPIYGPYALGTSAYAPTLSEWPGGGVVGVHGTNEPQLIPGRPSHGCIRLRDAAMARLWQIINVGTPIEIV
jgi:hypothetical protein